MNKTTTIIAVIVVVLAVAGGSFYGGMVYGKSQAGPQELTQEEMLAQFQAMRGAGGFPGGRQGGTGAAAGQAGAAGLGGAAGTVEKIDGDTMILGTTDGPVKVIISDNTLISKMTTIHAEDLDLGSNVIVAGSRNDDGSIQARSIQPSRASAGQAAGGGR
jgi:hypothetical protein